MINKIVVLRYAEAFIEYAATTIGVEKAASDFDNLKEIMRESPEFLDFMKSPEINILEKNSLIDKALTGAITDETRNFLKFLLEKKRIDRLEEIVNYIRVKYSRTGEIDAVLKISYPLDIDLIQKIKTRLQEKFNKQFKLFIELDGNLLGGVQVIIGNTVIDGSIRRRLDDLKEKLLTARV